MVDADRIDEARARFADGSALHAENDDPSAFAEHLRCVAEFHLGVGEIDAADAPLQRSLALATEIGADSLEQAAHERLAELWRRRGQFELSLTHFEAHHRLLLAIERRAALRDLEVQKWQAELEFERRERAHLALRYADLEVERDSWVGRAATLERDALQDDLTGLANRRAFHLHLGQAVAVAERGGAPATLVLLDLDRFKIVNDTLGHGAGDDVLRGVAAKLEATVRDADVIARVGGEEFALLLVGTDLAGGLTVAEKVRATLAANPWTFDGAAISVTASAGVATTGEAEPGPDALFARADRRLYRASRRGRNCVVADDR